MTDEFRWPPSRHRPAETSGGVSPTRLQVMVAPTRRTMVGHTVFGVLFFVVGIVAVVFALIRPAMVDRTAMFVVGGVFGALGLLFSLTRRRTLRTWTCTFTEAALEGMDTAARPFRLPWADCESIAIEGWAKANVLVYVLNPRRYRRTAYCYLRIRVRRDAEFTGTMASWPKRKYVRVRFWNRDELIDSFAYGCRTFAGEKFQGVTMW